MEAKNAAHAKGFNYTHIGICAISDGFYTEKQASALFDLIVELQEFYDMDVDDVLGHNEISPKTCPCFDVNILREAIFYQNKEMFLDYMRDKDKQPVQEIKYVPLTTEDETEEKL